MILLTDKKGRKKRRKWGRGEGKGDGWKGEEGTVKGRGRKGGRRQEGEKGGGKKEGIGKRKEDLRKKEKNQCVLSITKA